MPGSPFQGDAGTSATSSPFAKAPLKEQSQRCEGGRLFREQIQTVTKPRFYPWLCQFLMKIIPVINRMCACVKTSVEDNNFLTEGWRCVNLMICI